MAEPDAVTVEVIEHHLVSIAEEMKENIVRTAMSPIIYEVLDFSTGVFDRRGRLAAQASGLAIFLGTLDWAVAAVLEKFGRDDLHPGDVFLTNDPYGGGGTHLNDVVVVMPVFVQRELIGFGASRAHWNDVGGAVPLSIQTNARDLYAEGLRFPVVRLYKSGRLNRDLYDVIAANVRDSERQLGDLKAQIIAGQTAARRMAELARTYGSGTLAAAIDRLQEDAETIARQRLSVIPDGVFYGEDFLDDDGVGGPPTRIRVRVEKTADQLHFDFSGSDPVNPSGYNMSLCALVSACRIVFKAITDPMGLTCDGSFRPLRVTAPPGTVVNAQHPTPVSLYGEPARRAIDAVWRALAPVIPDRLPAGHFGSIAGVAMVGVDDRYDPPRPFTYQGPNGGGWGAAPGRDGESVLCCITNGDTRNTPAELIEAQAPLRVRQYALRTDSGGAGRWRGGLGAVYEFEVLTGGPVSITCALGRTDIPPFGVAGGADGAANVVEVVRDGRVRATLKRVTAFPLEKGDRVFVKTGGGGGYGDPRQRDPSAVAQDLIRGYISREAARGVYGHWAPGVSGINLAMEGCDDDSNTTTAIPGSH